MELSPAFSITSDMTDEELDLYFATCGSLSNLPTPPPAKEHTIEKPASTSTMSDLQDFAPELQAHATHLANLVPLSVSTTRPSVPAICGFLERSCLPDEVVAYAACVLDALSPRFAATWRETLPSNYARDLEFFMKTDTCHHASVGPDVLVLAALSLAHGFFNDTRRSAHYWAVGMSRNRFTIQELEASKRAILHDTDYGLCRITECMMDSMLRHMQRTKTSHAFVASAFSENDTVAKTGRRRNFSIDMSGTAMWKNGVQTPEPSP